MVLPRLYVPPPSVTPTRFGLMSVVQRPDATGRWEGGIEWQTEACGTTGYWPGPCSATAPDPDEKQFTLGRAVFESDPFVVYSGFTCQLLGSEDAKAIVGRQFALAEAFGIEKAFWEGAVDQTGLAGYADIDVLPEAATLTAAVGALERAIGTTYHGTPTIHAPRQVGAYAAERGLLIRDGSVARTPLDSLWAFGRGYDPAVGPEGESTPAGAMWLYATGAVTLRQGDIITSPPTLAASVDRTTNMVTVLAERLNQLQWDCAVVAVPVVLEGLDEEETA